MSEPASPFSMQVIMWAGIYLNSFIDKDRDYSDEQIERITRYAFVAARTTVTLMSALEESAKKRLT